ncbi:RNA ligase [Rhodococcus phage NiceHouse]|nr:RNA ligase [Rhodococcus phage NiceHouse]
MELAEYLDIEVLDGLIENGYVSRREHKEYPLVIFNYTPIATYNFKPRDWPDALMKCRGLIVHSTSGEIVAVCQPKFWNIDPETHNESGEFLTFDKMDGSMGVVYSYDNKLHVATRGSFHSEQAEWATEFIQAVDNVDYCIYLEGMIDAGFTPHVEIIYPDNKIVLEYDYSDLVLLGYQHLKANRWWVPANIDYNAYPGRVAEEFYAESITDLPAERDGKEGFIIFYPKSGNKYKIKHEHYMDLHRAIFNLTDRKIWDQVYAGTQHEFIANMPNEFQDEISRKADHYVCRAIGIQAECIDLYFNWLDNNPSTSKKDFAIDFKDHPLKYFLFMYWDRKSAMDIYKKILYSFRP